METVYVVQVSDNGRKWEYDRTCATKRLARVIARHRYMNHNLVRVWEQTNHANGDVTYRHYETLGRERFR